ncbi:MAG: hypothetical protein SH820_10930 [Xanthomonadales bacterium]|nr:hypothetical protein [Xanthomonadales bacterium]
MNHRHWSNVLRVALLLLMLSMQSFVLAHELNQGISHDNSICATCSIGSGHNGAIASHHECPIQIAICLHDATDCFAPTATPIRQTPEARAPPSSL